MINPQTHSSATDRRAICHDLLADLRAHGHEWLSGARNRTAAAKALALVERELIAISEGLSWREARALHDDGAPAEGEKVVEVSDDDLLDLRDLAEKSQAHNRHMLAALRDNKERLLACAVDREATERWIETVTANLVASEQHDARWLANYDGLLAESGSAHGGEAPES